MCRCTVTGIKVEGGLFQLVPAYQQEIMRLRAKVENLEDEIVEMKCDEERQER